MTPEVDTNSLPAPSRGGAPHKINWDEAREYYLSDKDLTFMDVVEKFGVSYKTVAKWSARQKWVKKRRDIIAERDLEAANLANRETDEQVNERHIEAYRQMQSFIKTNMAIAQGYMREKYIEAEKTGHAVDKKQQFSAQNVKYMMEAWKIAMDGERIGLGIATDSPKKTEKDVKISAQLTQYSRDQLGALFETGSELSKEFDPRKIIDGDVGG